MPFAAFLAVDRQLGFAVDVAAAEDRSLLILTMFDACSDAPGRPPDAVQCLVSAVTGDNGIGAVDSSGPWAQGSVSSALEYGRGTCAALAAITVSLGKDRGVPVRLVVAGTHVVAQDSAEPARLFELLEGGRETTLEEVLRRTRGAGPPIQVDSIDAFLPYYWDQLAVRASENGEDSVAEVAFAAAVRLAPRAWRIRFNYGTHLLERGRANEAQHELQRATRLECPIADCWSNLGVAYAKIGEERKAVRSFERALAIDPDHLDALRNLAQIRPQRPH